MPLVELQDEIGLTSVSTRVRIEKNRLTRQPRDRIARADTTLESTVRSQTLCLPSAFVPPHHPNVSNVVCEEEHLLCGR